MGKTSQPGHSRVRQILQQVLSWFKGKPHKEPETPEDPYAYVGAPKKPRPYNRGAAAVAELPEE